jgi:hypothetical protein
MNNWYILGIQWKTRYTRYSRGNWFKLKKNEQKLTACPRFLQKFLFLLNILTENRRKTDKKTDKKPTPCRFLKFSVSVFVGKKKADKTDKFCRFSDNRPTEILSVAILALRFNHAGKMTNNLVALLSITVAIHNCAIFGDFQKNFQKCRYLRQLRDKFYSSF